MKKIKVMLFMAAIMSASMLYGCNKEEAASDVVEKTETAVSKDEFGLNEDERQMYVEYAAGVLMKYNAGTNMRVLEGNRLVKEEAMEQAKKEQAAKREQLAAEYNANKTEESKENETSDGSGTGSASSSNSVSYVEDMAVATGMNAFSIGYKDYQLTNSYPEDGEYLFMAMDAKAGKTFLVAKFDVTNTSGQAEELDMFSQQAKFKLKLNGESYKAQQTLLLDDLSMYKDEIGAGESVETVLIFEIPEEKSQNIDSMELSITVGEQVQYMRLQEGTGVSYEEPANMETDNVSQGSEVQEAEVVTEQESTDSQQQDTDGEVTVVGSQNP